MGQLQLADVHVVLLQTVDPQQRVQVLGEHAELFQLAILIRHDLRKEFIQAHKALQVLAEQVELVHLLAGLLQRMLGFLQAGTVAVGFGGALVIQRLLARFDAEGVTLGEAFLSRLAVVAELAGRSLRVEEGQGERLDLLPVIDPFGIQLFLQVIDDLRVGNVAQLGLGVVRQKGVENVLRLIKEVEDARRRPADLRR